MSIDDLPLHPGLQPGPASCYLPPAIAVPDPAALDEVASRLARQFPTPYPATPGEVEMVAAGIALGCTSPRWRQGWFWRLTASDRAYDFRKMAEFMVTPDRFESARGRGWSPEWAREIHFQLPEPSERRGRVVPPPITPPPIPYQPGESIGDWLARVAAHRRADNTTPKAPHPARNTKYDNAPHLTDEEVAALPRRWVTTIREGSRIFDIDALQYDEVDGDFPDDTLDTREDW